MTNSHTEDTRQRLLDAATRLFAGRGFDGVSVKELADEAGVNVSLVSYHFGGKENLYRACLEQFGQERLKLAQRILQPPQTEEELRFKLKMFVEEMISAHLESRDVAQLVHRECEMELPVAADVFKNTFLKVFETVVTFFRSAQKAGFARKDLDPQMMAQFVFGSLTHALRSDKIASKYFGLSLTDAAYRRKLVEQLIQYCLFGISNDRSPQ